MQARAVTSATLGAWLLKTRAEPGAIDQLVRARFETVTARCVRRSYRTELIRPGQPVLLWLSGSSREWPAGIYAQGHTSGEARADLDQLVMPVALSPLSEPVPRSALLHHPELSQIEVIRMAAGSNPSYLTQEQLALLRAEWPQVTV